MLAHLETCQQGSSKVAASPKACPECAGLYGEHASLCTYKPRLSSYATQSPEMAAAVNIVRRAERDRSDMAKTLSEATAAHKAALGRERRAIEQRDEAIRAHRSQIDLTMAEAARADKAEALLRAALPMLADLVPKHAEAAELCRAITMALEPAPHPDVASSTFRLGWGPRSSEPDQQ